MNSIFSRRLSTGISVLAATLALTAGGTLTTAVLGLTPAASAQDQGAAQASAGQQRGRMGKILMSLNLTDAEKSQIRAIIADARKQNENVTDRDPKRANMKAAYAKIDTVLTPAQRTELHAKLDAMRAQNATAHAQ
jgi:Spy/CpxP family protein refolding chaperone